MFEAKSKVLQQIMDLCDDALAEKGKSRGKPAVMAMSIEAEPKQEEESKEPVDEKKSEQESDLSPEDLKALLSQLEG